MTLGALLAGDGVGARELADVVGLSAADPGDIDGGGVGSGNGSGLMLTGPDDGAVGGLPAAGAVEVLSGMKVLPSAGGFGGVSGTGVGITGGAAIGVGSGMMTGGEDESEGGATFGFGVGGGGASDAGGGVGVGVRFGAGVDFTGG